MPTPPDGITEADWLFWPASDQSLILTQQEDIQNLRQLNDKLLKHLTLLATELTELREPIGRTLRATPQTYFQ